MSYQPGEIYFVRESTDSGFGPYVKIGLVAKKENRSSFDRLKEHQTGNPRVLRIAEDQIVKTEAVSLVEAQLHKIFAPQRVAGEWFNFPTEDEVLKAISEAKRLAKEMSEIVPIFLDVDKLSKEVSASSTLPADEMSTTLSQTIAEKKGEVAVLESLEARIKELFKIAVESGKDLKGAAEEVSVTFKPVFKVDEFKIEHEDLYKKYLKVIQKWSGQFRPKAKGLALSELSNEFQAEIQILESMISKVSGPAEAYLLNEPQLVVTNLKALAEWEREIATARLQLVCGLNSAIDGICTWNRKFSDPKEIFDEKKFVEENPDLYLDYLADAKTGSYIKPAKRKA
jgi:hypothetical protein